MLDDSSYRYSLSYNLRKKTVIVNCDFCVLAFSQSEVLAYTQWLNWKYKHIQCCFTLLSDVCRNCIANIQIRKLAAQQNACTLAFVSYSAKSLALQVTKAGIRSSL